MRSSGWLIFSECLSIHPDKKIRVIPSTFDFSRVDGSGGAEFHREEFIKALYLTLHFRLTGPAAGSLKFRGAVP
jgi:hypothetical protein